MLKDNKSFNGFILSPQLKQLSRSELKQYRNSSGKILFVKQRKIPVDDFFLDLNSNECVIITNDKQLKVRLKKLGFQVFSYSLRKNDPVHFSAALQSSF